MNLTAPRMSCHSTKIAASTARLVESGEEDRTEEEKSEESETEEPQSREVDDDTLARSPQPTAVPPKTSASSRKRLAAGRQTRALRQKKRMGWQQALSTAGDDPLDVLVDPECCNISGSIVRLDSAPADVMLAWVDPAQHLDKFYVLQLIQKKGAGGDEDEDEANEEEEEDEEDEEDEGDEEDKNAGWAVYTRWGCTGTSGQALQQDFDHFQDAVQCFEDKFTEKTGVNWTERHQATVGGNYHFVTQNFTQKLTGYAGATWQYWVDDGVDGKVTGWYDYDVAASRRVERLFQEFQLNASFPQRFVTSGSYVYLVDLARLMQTNTTHPNHTSRRIRRVAPGDDAHDSTPPAPIDVAPVPVAPTSPVIPVSSPSGSTPDDVSSSGAVPIRVSSTSSDTVSNGHAGATWQYWVDDGVDGKVAGWYDYEASASQEVERVFHEFQLNASSVQHVVTSGSYVYLLDLARMIQINLTHPNHTSRRIRRMAPEEDAHDANPPAPVALAYPLPTLPPGYVPMALSSAPDLVASTSAAIPVSSLSGPAPDAVNSSVAEPIPDSSSSSDNPMPLAYSSGPTSDVSTAASLPNLPPQASPVKSSSASGSSHPVVDPDIASPGQTSSDATEELGDHET